MTARRTLTTVLPGETKAERIDAYRIAQDALEKCPGVIQSAENEIGTAAQARQAIAQLDGEIDELGDLASRCQAQNVFRSHHDSEVWPNGCPWDSDVNAFRARRNEAISLASLNVQEFAQARSKADQTHTDVIQMQQAARDFLNRVAALEAARAAYPSAHRDAESTIDSQSGQIQQYGNYSSSAKSSYDDAKDLLDKAESDARSGRYESALNNAKKAESEADGTGNRAKKAYDDYQEEQARKRREAAAAAAAAKAAAENASKQRTSDSADNSRKNGTSSSSSNHSGSDSHVGGGSDSHFRGGSDSHY